MSRINAVCSAVLFHAPAKAGKKHAKYFKLMFVRPAQKAAILLGIS